MTSIYALLDPNTLEPRYVGKTRVGVSTRLRGHMTTRKPVYSSHWVHGLKRRGLSPIALELETNLPESEWPEAEQFWIEYFRFLGANLTNHTKGGHHVVKAKCVVNRPRSAVEHREYQQRCLMLAKMKLTAMEHRILRYLEGIMDYDNVAAVTQAFLAKELDTTEATVSVSLKGLERAGLIERPKQHGVKVFKVAKHVAQRGKDKDPAK